MHAVIDNCVFPPERSPDPLELAGSRKMLDLHVGNSPLAVVEWDPQFRVRRWSGRATEMFGWTEAEVLGMHPDDWRFMHEADAPKVAQIIGDLVTRKLGRNISPNRNYTRDGQVIHCEWFNSAIFDDDGELVSILSLAQDVTDRELALIATRESEQRFKATFEQAAVGIAHVGLEGRWLRVNNTLCALLGYAQTDFMALTFQDITHPDDLASDMALLGQLLRAEIDHYRIEKRYFRRDGTPVWALLTVSLVPDAHGAPLHFISVIEDISARKATELALQQSTNELEARVLARTLELETINRCLSEEVEQRSRAEAALRESEMRMRSVLENSHDAFVATDEAGTIVEWNSSAETTFGWTRDEAIGLAMHDLIVPPAYQEAHRVGMARFNATGQQKVLGRRLQMSAMHRSGRELPIELTISQIRLGEGHMFTAFLHDITDRIAADRTLQDSEARLRLVADNVPALIGYVDRDLRYRFTNAAHREWLGWDPEALTGLHMREVLDPATFDLIEPRIARVFRGERVSFDRPFRLPDGRVRHGHVTYIPDFDDASVVRGFYAMASDITARTQLAQVLEKRAFQDELTGLLNRAAWADRFEQALEGAEGDGSPVALMFLDLDGFKSVNDVHGHEAGDAMLREFAARLAASVRKSDTVARFAGDEFVVLLDNINPLELQADLATIARKILAAMAPGFEYGGQRLPLSTSIGIAVQYAGPASSEKLLRHADAAMYVAKRSGGNSFELTILSSA